MKKLFSIALAGVMAVSAAAVLSACGDGEYPVEIANYKIEKEPENVVALDAAAADIISYMGYDRKLAGRSEEVDQEKLSAAPVVGTSANPDIGKITETNAEIVFADDDLSDTAQEELEKANIKVIKLQQANSSKEVETNYVTIGKILSGNITGKKDGEDSYDRLVGEMDTLKKSVEDLSGSGALQTICYLYYEDNGLKLMTSGTYGNILMGYTNCVNVAVNIDQNTVDVQTLQVANPNFIFYSDEAALNAIKSDSVLSKLAAVTNNKMMQIPIKEMRRPGFTAIDTLTKMINFIYDGQLPATPDEAVQAAASAPQADAQPSTAVQATTAAPTEAPTEAPKSVAGDYKIDLDGLTLKKQDNNDDVKAMQQRLSDLGYIDDSENVTGYYGSVTEQAVKDFQKASGIEETGEADNATLNALFMSDAKKKSN